MTKKFENSRKHEETKKSTGLFPVEQNCYWGYIDRTEKIVIKPQFDRAYDFSEGLACVCIGGKDGFIDKTGKMVIELQFARAHNFSVRFEN